MKFIDRRPPFIPYRRTPWHRWNLVCLFRLLFRLPAAEASTEFVFSAPVCCGSLWKIIFCFSLSGHFAPLCLSEDLQKALLEEWRGKAKDLTVPTCKEHQRAMSSISTALINSYNPHWLCTQGMEKSKGIKAAPLLRRWNVFHSWCKKP